MIPRPILVAIAPAQLYEHVSTARANVFLKSPDMSSSMSMPASGETLDDEPVKIVRREGRIFVYHGPQAHWATEHFDFLP